MWWYSAQADLMLDEQTREMRAGGVLVNLPRKCFELMVFLAHRSERVVSRQELFDAVWPGVQVTQSSLNQVVSLLRSALGPQASRILTTVRGSGYRLNAFHRARPESSLVANRDDQQRPTDAELQELCSATLESLERTTEALQKFMLLRPISPQRVAR
jgi:DNA-binding winged helix-turn-helix (wHTH) protein